MWPVDKALRIDKATASTSRRRGAAQSVVTNSESWAALRHSTMSMTSP